MWSTSSMIKASELKEGDKITCADSKEYLVIHNRNELPTKRLILRDISTREVVLFYDVALFYDEDVECAKNTFGIDLLG